MLNATIACSLFLLVSFHYADTPYPAPSSLKVPQLAQLSKKEQVITRGMVWGQKPREKAMKSAIANLHIHHLFTPSGLHLSSLLWFMALFSLERIALLLLLPLVVLVEGFFAFKRVYCIKLITSLLRMKNIHVDSKHVFLLVFALEFILRAHLSPLSFTYSFLFLGIIYSLRHSSPLILLTGLWFGQLLISCFQQDLIHLLALPLNSLLTLIITLCYPLILLNTFIPIGLCNLLYDLILWFNDLLCLWDIKAPAIILTFLTAIPLMKNIRLPAIVMLVFISTTLY